MKRVKTLTPKELDASQARRMHDLKPDDPRKQPSAFIEAMNIFEIEQMLQLMPGNFLEKRLTRTQLKWFVKTVEAQMKIVIDSPYDKNSQNRRKYVTKDSAPQVRPM